MSAYWKICCLAHTKNSLCWFTAQSLSRLLDTVLHLPFCLRGAVIRSEADKLQVISEDEASEQETLFSGLTRIFSESYSACIFFIKDDWCFFLLVLLQ